MTAHRRSCAPDSETPPLEDAVHAPGFAGQPLAAQAVTRARRPPGVARAEGRRYQVESHAARADVADMRAESFAPARMASSSFGAEKPFSRRVWMNGYWEGSME